MDDAAVVMLWQYFAFRWPFFCDPLRVPPLPLPSRFRHMRRLFRLSGRCLSHLEPLLLVGATGCGKTTVCQLYSMLLNRRCVVRYSYFEVGFPSNKFEVIRR